MGIRTAMNNINDKRGTKEVLNHDEMFLNLGSRVKLGRRILNDVAHRSIDGLSPLYHLNHIGEERGPHIV
jgi:hypothetical protein